MEPTAARCAVHAEAEATLACLRCGAFACSACSVPPSVLCAECAARVPGRAGTEWAAIPPAPTRVGAALVSVPSLYALLAGLALLRFLGPRTLALTAAMLLVALITLVLGVVRLARALAGLTGRRALRAALRTMHEQRYAEASVALEEVLRSQRLEPATRALALYLLAANVASAGELERARTILEALVPSGWRHIGSGKLLRGQGQVVLAVVRALCGDGEGARAAREAARFGWIARVSYSPAYGDAVICARRGEHERALTHAVAARRFAARRSLVGLDRSAALVEAFVRERLGEGDTAVETALAPARRSPRGAHDGLGAHWPQMRDFLARRLPTEAPTATHVSGHPPADHL